MATAKATAAVRRAAPAGRTPPRKKAAARPSVKSAAATPSPAPAAAQPVPKARVAAAKSTATDRTGKPQKLKLVRDTFTMPKPEHGAIGVLKTRASRLGRPAKKNEILRAGLKALEALSDAEFLACVSSLSPTRPADDAKA